MSSMGRPTQANQGWGIMSVLFYTAWFFFLSAALVVKAIHLINDVPSQNATAINTIISATSIHTLDLAKDKPFIALAGIIIAIAMDLVDSYMETNIPTFVSFLIVAVLGMGICTFALVTSHSRETSGQGSPGSRLFVVMSYILKLLYKNGVIPVVAEDWHNVQDVLFVASFTWSILALWLQATGISILSPVRRASYSIARENWSSLAASILYWTAAVLVVVTVMIIVAVSPAGTPIIAKVAGIVFGICTTVVLCTLSDD